MKTPTKTSTQELPKAAPEQVAINIYKPSPVGKAVWLAAKADRTDIKERVQNTRNLVAVAASLSIDLVSLEDTLQFVLSEVTDYYKFTGKTLNLTSLLECVTSKELLRSNLKIYKEPKQLAISMTWRLINSSLDTLRYESVLSEDGLTVLVDLE